MKEIRSIAIINTSLLLGIIVFVLVGEIVNKHYLSAIFAVISSSLLFNDLITLIKNSREDKLK